MYCGCFATKQEAALFLLQDAPLKWFRDSPIDQRDLNLIRAERVPWLDYTKASFLRKIYHMKAGEEFKQTNWTCEEDETCKEIVRSCGGQLVGFGSSQAASVHWASVAVNVNITGSPQADFHWGFLSTRPSNIRIFKGPPETCAAHPWDAMFLRDCKANTTALHGVEAIAAHRFDILCMKMCEDYDNPWVVIAVKDVGVRRAESPHDCQDTSACGCVFAH